MALGHKILDCVTRSELSLEVSPVSLSSACCKECILRIASSVSALTGGLDLIGFSASARGKSFPRPRDNWREKRPSRLGLQ